MCKFAVIGREVCPSTGTTHLQGFWYVNKKKYTPREPRWYCGDSAATPPSAEGKRAYARFPRSEGGAPRMDVAKILIHVINFISQQLTTAQAI